MSSFVPWGGGGFGASGLLLPLTMRTSAVSTSTGVLGFANVYRMLTPGTTLTISSAHITDGRLFEIAAISANGGSPVTIATEGAEKINAGDTLLLTANFASVLLRAFGGNLEIRSS